MTWQKYNVHNTSCCCVLYCIVVLSYIRNLSIPKKFDEGRVHREALKACHISYFFLASFSFSSSSSYSSSFVIFLYFFFHKVYCWAAPSDICWAISVISVSWRSSSLIVKKRTCSSCSDQMMSSTARKVFSLYTIHHTAYTVTDTSTHMYAHAHTQHTLPIMSFPN